MQRLRQRQMCKARLRQKKVDSDAIVFLGREGKVYLFDGELPPRLYSEEIPIIKKRKRKKEFPRGTIIRCSITETGNSKSFD